MYSAVTVYEFRPESRKMGITLEKFIEQSLNPLSLLYRMTGI